MALSHRGRTPLRELTQATVSAAEESRDEFYRLFGRFVIEFAFAELETFNVFVLLSKTPRKHAAAIFSGIRTNVAIAHIRTLIDLELADDPSKDYGLLLDALDQLRKISAIRDLALHNGVTFWMDRPAQVDNSGRAPKPSSRKEFSVTPDDLEKMISDLDKIFKHYCVQFASTEVQMFEHVRSSVRARWRYKSPLEGNPHPSRSPPKPKLKDRPKSSQG